MGGDTRVNSSRCGDGKSFGGIMSLIEEAWEARLVMQPLYRRLCIVVIHPGYGDLVRRLEARAPEVHAALLALPVDAARQYRAAHGL